jgi:hypothetical protein
MGIGKMRSKGIDFQELQKCRSCIAACPEVLHPQDAVPLSGKSLPLVEIKRRIGHLRLTCNFSYADA